MYRFNQNLSMSFKYGSLTLKRKKVDPDQASIERNKSRADEHNNIWFAQSKFTQLLDVFCIFFDEQNNMFPPVQVDPAKPSQPPLRGASRKVPESPGGAQRVHPPAQESRKKYKLVDVIVVFERKGGNFSIRILFTQVWSLKMMGPLFFVLAN